MRQRPSPSHPRGASVAVRGDRPAATLLVVVTIVTVVAIVAIPARLAIAAATLARALAVVLVLALVLATARPDGVGQQIEAADRRLRIVAVNHEFAGARAFLGRLVADHQVQARPRVQRRGKRVVHETPVRMPAPQPGARDLDLAVADVAQRDRALGAAAGLDAAEAGGPGDDEPARRRLAAHGERERAGRIVAD